MGCWNGTDGLGGVPIEAGKKIKAVIIQNNSYHTDATGFCDLNGYATPISFTLDGVYNDYGGIEDLNEKDRSAFLLRELIERELKDGTIIVGNPENTGNTDSEITTLEGITLTNFINKYIAEDKVYRKYIDYDNKIHYTNVGLMMFSDAIFTSVSKAILADNSYGNKDATEESIYSDTVWFLEDNFESRPLSERDKKYIEIYTKDLEKAETEEEKAEILEEIEDIKSGGPRFGSPWRVSSSRQYNKDYNIMVMLSSYEYVNTKVFDTYYDLIKVHYKKYDKMVYSKMFKDFVLLLKSMNSLRRPWQGLPGLGSQLYDKAAFIGLFEGIKKQIEDDMKSRLEYGSFCHEDWCTFHKDKEYEVTEVDYKSYTLKDEYGDFVTITREEYNKYFEY
jgi:hypothetical protein